MQDDLEKLDALLVRHSGSLDEDDTAFLEWLGSRLTTLQAERDEAIAAAKREGMLEAAGIAEDHRYEDSFLNSCGIRREHRNDIAQAIRTAAGGVK